MSWSVQYAGKPEAISAKLKEHSSTLNGPSKEEFDAALPHIDALLKMNHNSHYPGLAVKLVASGHAWSDTTNSYSNCQVSIQPLDIELV